MLTETTEIENCMICGKETDLSILNQYHVTDCTITAETGETATFERFICDNCINEMNAQKKAQLS